MMKKFLAKSYLYVLLLVLYAPIAIIILFSFTNSKTIGDWRGFSLDLYSNLLSGQAAHSATITQAVLNTLIIAVIAATLSITSPWTMTRPSSGHFASKHLARPVP